MKKILIFLMLFAGWQVQAQSVDKLSPLQQIEYYKAQIDSANQERNALKIAAIYGEIVALCRETPVLEEKLPEYLYEYGTWSTYAGNHQTAIQAMIELLDMPDNPDDKSLFTLKARANNGLGMTYFFLERWDNALVHYQKARDMATELQNRLGISIAENNIGNIYQKKGNYRQAIEHYRRCLQLQEEINDRETICNTYFNLATCYIELSNFNESLPNFDLALNMAREIGDKEIESLCLVRLATYHAKEKRQFIEAIKQIDRAELIAEEAGYRQVLEDIYHTRSAIEEARGDFASALAYFKKHKMLKDSLFNEKTVNQLQEYEVRYQTKEKELEIERQQAEISRHKTRLFIVTCGLIVAGLLLVLLIYIVRLRNKRNRELADMNATKDKFFSIISHDLKNPAVAQRDALQLLLDNSDQWNTASLTNYYQKLLKSANGQVALLYDLLNWAQVQTGRMPYNLTQFDLATALQSCIGLIRNMAESKGVIFDVQMPETALVTGDHNMLTTVVRNLLDNAVKFTEKGGNVLLQIDDAGRKYTVSISDTGIGMNSEQMENLFRIDYRRSRKGTAGEQGTGMGLIVCKELIEKHGSRLYVESEEGHGSRFTFEL